MAKQKAKDARRNPGGERRRPETGESPRTGSHAGRGYRYQDAVSVVLAVEIWAGHRPPASVIPEGGDDVELRGEEVSFVQVKSRRAHLGEYTVASVVGDVNELRSRARQAVRPPERLELVLERRVAGVSMSSDAPSELTIDGALGRQLKENSTPDSSSEALSIRVAESPQEAAIGLLVDRLGCPPLAAQLCFAELLVRIGDLADANGMLTPDRYAGLSLSDTDAAIHGVLGAVDVSAIELALQEGVCESIDFLTPLDDPNFYLGVDVEPGHLAANLVLERPAARLAVMGGIEERRAALVVGPSGAGKSALMWEAAAALRHTVRWFRIRRLSAADIPAVRQLIRTFRASEGSPIGFVVDDVGRRGPNSWGALLKEAASLPGVILLGSVREEDVTLIAERARSAEIRAEPDDGLAERLWSELVATQRTTWTGWREPWALSGGLLLEYVHILTRERRLRDVLSDQVSARIADVSRALELDVLRPASWASVAGVELDITRLIDVLDVREAQMLQAMNRLIEEHLIQVPADGFVAGLHQLRSEALLSLTHRLPLPTLARTFEHAIASVSVTGIELLVTDALSHRRLPLTGVLGALIPRLEREPHPLALASALRGLGAGHVITGVTEWLDTSEAQALSRTQIATAAMLGITDTDLGALPNMTGIQAAATRLTRIKGLPEDDPRQRLLAELSPGTLTEAIRLADSRATNEILSAAVGMELPDGVRSAVNDPPSDFQTASLADIAEVLGTAAEIDRRIAVRWVEQVGQAALFDRVRSETAWADHVSIENVDGLSAVRGNYWYVAPSRQPIANEAVVDLCETILALCPLADKACSSAITVGGEIAGFGDLPLADKQILRESLPPAAIKRWNGQWMESITRHVAAPSYSDYLSRGVAILDALAPLLEKIFDSLLSRKLPRPVLIEEINSLNREVEALTPPSASAFVAAGVDAHVGKSKTLTRFQHVLHGSTVSLIKRYGQLPEGGGAYIAWLTDLIADIDTAAAEEPWRLIIDDVPPTLYRLKTILERVRQVAGEAHEKKVVPTLTRASHRRGAAAGLVLRRAAAVADAAAKGRVLRRKKALERAVVEAEVEATIHLRINSRKVSPWPSVDVLALLPVRDLEEALVVLDAAVTHLPSIVGDSTHLTIMPILEGVAYATLAHSGHAALRPDLDGGTRWADSLDIPLASSDTTTTFGNTLEVAAELGAMDRRSLGVPGRPSEEIEVRRDLQVAFDACTNRLDQQCLTVNGALTIELRETVARFRAGDVDYTAEIQAALDEGSSPIIHDVGFLTLQLIEHDRQSVPLSESEHAGP